MLSQNRSLYGFFSEDLDLRVEKFAFAAFYQKESDAAKRAAFLKEEYGIGGWTFQFEEGVTGWVDWNARGLSIKKFHDED